MKTLRFFTVPTLLGWAAAYATCVLLHLGSSVIRDGFPSERSATAVVQDYALALFIGCVLIVLPTYFLVTLPISILDLRAAAWGDRPVSRNLYAGALLASGLLATGVFRWLKLTDIGWAESESAQMLLFYAPFLPYAAVVAIAAKRTLPIMNEERA